ncbi:hypothetical protein BMW23_0787 [Bodo saltans virus]|uniref:Transmembrane protein n=1 Tax=Bodo saltans virus TaxID=2024608 RepID=A0A2H4UV81_9VIRU|nr:hypothetical protein QJ851_gp0770 [Bodo saltans virus]ATZ80833.1 hypothetical protein BMW23_0787 [Bodo saltans virus]
MTQNYDAEIQNELKLFSSCYEIETDKKEYQYPISVYDISLDSPNFNLIKFCKMQNKHKEKFMFLNTFLSFMYSISKDDYIKLLHSNIYKLMQPTILSPNKYNYTLKWLNEYKSRAKKRFFIKLLFVLSLFVSSYGIHRINNKVSRFGLFTGLFSIIVWFWLYLTESKQREKIYFQNALS